MTTDIKKFETYNLPNIYYTNGTIEDYEGFCQHMKDTVKQCICISLMVKGSRTSSKEFKFFVDSTINNGKIDALQKLGKILNKNEMGEKFDENIYVDFYNSDNSFLKKEADYLLRNLYLKMFIEGKSNIKINELTDPVVYLKEAVKSVPVVYMKNINEKNLPIIKDHMYTITVDLHSYIEANKLQESVEEIGKLLEEKLGSLKGLETKTENPTSDQKSGITELFKNLFGKKPE